MSTQNKIPFFNSTVILMSIPDPYSATGANQVTVKLVILLIIGQQDKLNKNNDP